jgi:hypothetical protein
MTEFTIGEKIERYLAIRAKKKALDDAHDATTKPYSLAMETLENDFLDEMNKQNLQNLKGSNGGVAYKTTIMQCTMEDRSALVRHVMSDPAAFDVFTNSLAKDFVKTFVEEHKEPPPGVKVTYLTKVNVRK